MLCAFFVTFKYTYKFASVCLHTESMKNPLQPLHILMLRHEFGFRDVRCLDIGCFHLNFQRVQDPDISPFLSWELALSLASYQYIPICIVPFLNWIVNLGWITQQSVYLILLEQCCQFQLENIISQSTITECNDKV